jgi:hypothetical protein
VAHPEDPQRVLTAGPAEIVASYESSQIPSAPAGPDVVGARRAAFTFLLAFVVCTLVYLAFAVQGKWFSSVSNRFFGAESLVMARGSAIREGEEFVITRAGQGGETIVSVVTDLRSSDFPVIAWVAIDVPEAAQVALLWHTDYEPAQVRKLPMRVVSGRLLPVAVSTDPHWIGRITGLALAIHGPLPQPIRIRGVIAKPADAKETLLDRIREWTALEPWTGTSINTVTGGADIQDLPLPLLLVVALAIAAVVLMWQFRRQLRTIAPSLAIVIAGLFVLAWFALDARWTFNLARQAYETSLRYAGKDWRNKHLAADDAPLFAFIEKVRALLPQTPARVFVLADEHYYRGRAAFHLYPHNVWYEPYYNTVPPANRLHAGDFIVVYQRRGVQYDAAARRLRWDGDVTVPAELKLADGGGALFVVR